MKAHRLIRSLMPCLGLLLLSSANGHAADDAIDELRETWLDTRSEAIDAYVTAIEEELVDYYESTDATTTETIDDLTAIAAKASRRGEHAIAMAAWTEVLARDPEHTDAIAFLEATGALDAARERIATADEQAEADTGFLGETTGPVFIAGTDTPASVVAVLEEAYLSEMLLAQTTMTMRWMCMLKAKRISAKPINAPYAA